MIISKKTNKGQKGKTGSPASSSRKIRGKRLKFSRRRTTRTKTSDITFFKSFSASPMAAALTSVKTGNYLDVNQKFLSLFECRRSLVIGKTPDELGFRFDADERKKVLNNFRKKETEKNFAFRIRTKKGHVKHVLVSAESVDVNGEKCRLSHLLDVTERIKADDEIKESEEKFRGLLENSRDVIFNFDIKKRKYIYVSPSSKEILGIDPLEFIIQKHGVLTSRIHKDERRKIKDHFKKIFKLKGRKKKSFFIEYRILFNETEYRWVADNHTVVYDTKGIPASLVGNISDVTFRKEAQEELVKSYELQKGYLDLLSSVQNALPAHIAMLDRKGNIVAVNESWRKYSDENPFIHNDFGKGIDYIKVCRFCKGVHSAEGKAAAKGIRKILACKAAEFHMEYPCHTQTEYRWFRLIITPINKQHNEGAVVMHMDVTERKKAELALKESETQLRQLFEEDLTGNYIADIGGKVLICNPAFAEIIGYEDVKQVLNTRKFRIFSSDFGNTKFVSLLERNQKIPVHEREITRHDGRKITILENIIGNYDADGRLMNVQGYLMDITGKKEAEQALKLSEEQYKLLFYDNPLPMWVFDSDSLRIIAVNDESILSYGYSKSEFLKMRVTDLIHPVERKRFMEYRKNSAKIYFRSKARNVGIWKHVTKKSNVIDVEITRRPILFQGKKAILVLAKDITLRVKAQELLKKRTEELALLYESSKELSNTLEIQSIYERTYRIVSKLMPCSGMGISSYDEKEKLISAQIIWQDGKKHDTSQIPSIRFDEEGKGLQSRVIKTRKSVIINDYDKYLQKSKTVYYIKDDSSVSIKRDMIFEIAKSALLVPLITEGKVIGVIQILSSQNNAFNEDNLRMLEALSSQAAAAMTNARLYNRAQNEIAEKQKAQEALKRRTEEISILYEAQKEISNTLEPNIVFDNIYKSVSAIMPCDSMIISSFNKEREMIRIMAVWADGVKPSISEYPELPLAPEGFGIQSQVIRSGESRLILDYEKQFKKSISNYSYSNDEIESNAKILYSSALLVPMKLEGNVIGTIQVLSYEKNAFNADNLRMLESLTSPITAATVNAGLYQQAQKEIDERIKKEIELKEIRRNMEEAQRISHIGNWVLNTETNEIYNSAEVYSILGIEPITSSVPFKQMLNSIHEEDRDLTQKLISEAISEKRSYINEDRIVRPGGEVRFVRIMGEPIIDENGNQNGMQGTMQDITDLKRINDELVKSLGEKELMLKEIHHRVKNNLQVVSSLLRLQSEKIKDKTTVEYFKLSEQRVKSMALIHQQLYKSKDLSKINFRDYLKELCSYLFFVNGVSSGRIKLNILVDEVFFGIDTALPCGLIVNELVTNSIKHAFPDGRKGNICISLEEYKETWNRLIIKDDGVGVGELDFRNSASLGMELVDTLTDQIDGRIEVNTDCGTEVRIIFKELYYKKRL